MKKVNDYIIPLEYGLHTGFVCEKDCNMKWKQKLKAVKKGSYLHSILLAMQKQVQMEKGAGESNGKWTISCFSSVDSALQMIEGWKEKDSMNEHWIDLKREVV